MEGGEKLALGIAGLLFGVFFINVAMGAIGVGAFLSDVGEMVVLFATSIAFVIAILGLERKARATAAKTTNHQGGET